jgi:hypothetical protein
MSSRPTHDEIAASILKVAAPFVEPLQVRGAFTENESRFRLEILDGESSVLEWDLLSEYTRDPEHLARVLEGVRLNLEAMGYSVGPPSARSH